MKKMMWSLELSNIEKKISEKWFSVGSSYAESIYDAVSHCFLSYFLTFQISL